ncbi:MAG: glucose-6-phosphate dehydrogenase, partial [Glaciimonas sp.]|nr:glucose-6-phosphate dehydrogenase [Glaciimonas sp.]
MALAEFDLAIFGGTGDLAMRKLLPAMYSRDRADDLPPNARILCIGRHNISHEDFLKQIERDAQPHISMETFDTALWDRFCTRLRYVAMDATDATSYKALVTAMRSDPKVTNVFYLATPPALFSKICRNLSSCGLATPNSRVVLEKPLGRDLTSAKQINAEVGQIFSESQIFRIDHYLGKETVQNLLALR